VLCKFFSVAALRFVMSSRRRIESGSGLEFSPLLEEFLLIAQIGVLASAADGTLGGTAWSPDEVAAALKFVRLEGGLSLFDAAIQTGNLALAASFARHGVPIGDLTLQPKSKVDHVLEACMHAAQHSHAVAEFLSRQVDGWQHNCNSMCAANVKWIKSVSEEPEAIMWSLLDEAVYRGLPDAAARLSALGVRSELGIYLGAVMQCPIGDYWRLNPSCCVAAAAAGLDLRALVMPTPPGLLQPLLEQRQQRTQQIIALRELELQEVRQQVAQQFKVLLELGQLTQQEEQILALQELGQQELGQQELRQQVEQQFKVLLEEKMRVRMNEIQQPPRPLRNQLSATTISLLAGAIGLGQPGLVKYLCEHCCDSNLTSQDLMALEQVGARVKQAASVAYRCSRHRYQILLVQMSSWWHRCEGTSSPRVLHPAVIDKIAVFALAVPPIPEELQSPQSLTAIRNARNAASASAASNPSPRVPPSPASIAADSADSADVTSTHPSTIDHEAFQAKSNDDEAELEEIADALARSEADAAEQENTDIAAALLHSKVDAPPLSGDNVVVLRLSSRSADIEEKLLAAPALAQCRDLVADAGCEVLPSWANGAVLLVPLTVAQVEEAGLELRAHHIVALEPDRARVEEAIADLPYRRRPKVRPEHQTMGPRDAEQVLESQHARGSNDVGPLEDAAFEGLDGQETSNRIEISVERTFVHFPDRKDAAECSVKALSAP